MFTLRFNTCSQEIFNFLKFICFKVNICPAKVVVYTVTADGINSTKNIWVKAGSCQHKNKYFSKPSLKHLLQTEDNFLKFSAFLLSEVLIIDTEDLNQPQSSIKYFSEHQIFFSSTIIVNLAQWCLPATKTAPGSGW